MKRSGTKQPPKRSDMKQSPKQPSKQSPKQPSKQFTGRDVAPRQISFADLQSEQYDQLQSQFAPLDILFFRGADFISDCIAHLQEKRLGMGDVSHVGLLVNKDILPLDTLEPGKWYVFESTFTASPGSLMTRLGFASPGIDVNTKCGKLGVQLRELQGALATYLASPKAHVSWGKLKDNPFPNNPTDIKEKFTNLYHKYYGRMYQINILQLLASLYPGWRKPRFLLNFVEAKAIYIMNLLHLHNGNVNHPGWQFCSELVGNIYKGLGILPSSTNTSDIVPADFLGYDEDGIPEMVERPIFITLAPNSIFAQKHARMLRKTKGFKPREETGHHKIHKRAVLIGINYEGTNFALGGCISDAENAKKMLMEQFGYEERFILLLTDHTSIKPTRNIFFKAWSWLISGATVEEFEVPRIRGPLPDGSQLYFHYSGHGAQVRAQKDRFEQDGLDETMCPLDWEKAGMIIDDDVFNHLARPVPASCRLYGIADCCHSGTDIDLAYITTSRPGAYQLQRLNGYPETAANVVFITGCKDDQLSADVAIRESDGILHNFGALSYAYFKTLRERNHRISIRDLLNLATNAVRAMGMNNQTPCVSSGRDGILDIDWLSM